MEIPKQSESVEKHKGRQKGATQYSEGDLIALLDAVKEILPTSDNQWLKVETYYNIIYAEKWKRGLRNAKGLKTKFRELSHGTSTGGGKRDDFEKKAKEIDKLIDHEGQILVSDQKEEKEDSEKEEKRIISKGKTRIEFEKKIGDYVEYCKSSEVEKKEIVERHHTEILERLDRLLDILAKKL